MAKDFVIIKGRVVKMTDAAYKIAEKHFGATKNRPAQQHVPMELLKMPKLPIIPADKVVVSKLEKTELPPVKTEDVKPVEVPVEVTKVEKTEVPVVKKTAKRKK